MALAETYHLVSAPSRPAPAPGMLAGPHVGRDGRERTGFVWQRCCPAHPAPTVGFLRPPGLMARMLGEMGGVAHPAPAMLGFSSYNLTMPKYDPRQHHRRSIRLKGWDYRAPGVYFVTICTFRRENLFEHPAFYEIAANALRRVPEQEHAGHVRLDVWVVMPNHAHLIFIFVDWPDGVEAETAAPIPFQNAAAGSLGVVVGQYKKGVTARINQLRKARGTAVWQRGYYERIIRNQRDLNAVRQYIQNNPTRWAEDRDNLDNLFRKMTYHP